MAYSPSNGLNDRFWPLDARQVSDLDDILAYRSSRRTIASSLLTPDEIRSVVQRLNSKSVADKEAAWAELRDLGVALVPYLAEAYPSFGLWQGRVSLVFHSIRYARVSEDAFKLGMIAINDRATLVRYRACGLLAYSLRKDALKPLKALLKHKDGQTVNDAKAAIRAIKKQNHHLFIDRGNTGRTHWVVNESDRETR